MANSIRGTLTRLVRQFKGTYVLNNLLHANQLKHNRRLYKKYQIGKSIYAPIGNQDFKTKASERPWLDQDNALDQLRTHPTFATFSPDIQRELERFVTDGYMILRGFFPKGDIQAANEEIEGLLSDKKVGFHYTGRKILQSYKVAPTINKRFFRRPELLDLLSFIMGKQVIPFQTINFIQGSEQRAHSDSIHMTTHPLGYLIACWVALEPIHSGNGPLIYYPGSHRLPYVLSADYQSGNTAFTIGANSNKQYEDAIEKLIEQEELKPEIFTADPGDMLIWHANLLHGGSGITKGGVTRKSLVAHYYTKEVICYHDMSQRPALLDPEASERLAQK